MFSRHWREKVVAPFTIIPPAKAGLAPTGMEVSPPILTARARGQ